MNDFWEFLKKLTDPESILSYGGLALLVFVIFAETGLLIGFFLPGDSLVFLSGVFCATKPQYLTHTPFVLLVVYLCAAAITGNMFGYFFGKKTGQKLLGRKDSFFFKQRYVEITRVFYEKHGRKALILGRFLPYIRTFVPILAGVIKIDFKRFMLYNIGGAVLWIGSIASAGFFLGQRYPQIENYLGYIVIGFIVITTIPVVITYFSTKNKKQ